MRITEPGSLTDWLPPLPKSKYEDLYKTPRTQITPRAVNKSTANADDYKAARKAIAARSAPKKSTPAPKKSSSSAPSNLSGFAGSLGGGFSGGSSNPYLDIIGSLKDDKTFEDYMAEANKIYKPSLDYLKGMETQATNRAGQYDKDLAGMYEALVGTINNQQPVIDQNYNNAISEQNNITSDAKTAVGNNYSNSQAQQAAMLKQLGIEAAAPETLQRGQDSQAFFQSLLDTQGSGYDQFLNSQKVASKDFNTAQSNIAAQTGTNARADLKMQLQDILGQYGGKEADLQTQINQQAVQMQTGAAQSLLDQQKMMMDAVRYNNTDQMNMANYQEKVSNDQANLNLRNATLQAQIEKNRADAELGAAKLAAPPKAAAAKPDPWAQVASMAKQLYSGNSTGATNAFAALQNAVASYGANGSKPTLGAFLNNLLSRVSPTGKPTGGGDTGQLTQLATFLYNQLYK